MDKKLAIDKMLKFTTDISPCFTKFLVADWCLIHHQSHFLTKYF